MDLCRKEPGAEMELKVPRGSPTARRQESPLVRWMDSLSIRNRNLAVEKGEK